MIYTLPGKSISRTKAGPGRMPPWKRRTGKNSRARFPASTGPGSLAEYDAQVSAVLRGESERMVRPVRRVEPRREPA